MALSGVGYAETNIMTGSVHVNGVVGSGAPTVGIGYLNNTDSLVGNVSVHGSYYYKAYKRYWGQTVSESIYIIPTNDEVLLYEDFRQSSPQDPPGIESSGVDSLTRSLASNMDVKLRVSIAGSYEAPPSYGYVKAYAIFTTNSIYHISGTTDCVNNVSLYYNNSGSWTYMITDSLTNDYYNFNVTNGTDFKLIFDDGHSYEFNVTGNIVYNYDACVKTTYKFWESCDNLIPDTDGWYSAGWTSGGGYSKYFYAPDGILDISNESLSDIDIYTTTFAGTQFWKYDEVLPDHTYPLRNIHISWGLKVIVQNESNDALIDGAMVKVDQTCYCTSDYSTRQKLTVNGMTQFGEMSLQDASLLVMKDGYKPLSENSTGYSAYLSGRSNFSSKTWIVKLANTSSNNSSSFYEVNNTVDIHFVDVTGNRTSKILDTDSEVYLYYENNNTEKEAMTLKFQSSATHTYFIDEQSWTIPYDAIGHKTIANSYFTPWDYSYRAIIYNSSIYGWNMTIPLTVRNGTREEEQHYENLTTGLWFLYASDGKVDYRNDMKVAIHAGSNNTTLLNIDVELWKDGVYIACKNLTATDFTGADFPYYYTWNPVFDYITGSNYSVRMYGFDRTLLETDYVQCVTDETTRKNKLTIGVKDKGGNNLNNAYIYLENWGSLPTGSMYYNSYEGIDNGDYRYKASKTGYTGSGWESVNLTDEDKIVWYTLISDYTNKSCATQKFSDGEIREFFFPLMFFLFICIVLGGLKYVTQ